MNPQPPTLIQTRRMLPRSLAFTAMVLAILCLTQTVPAATTNYFSLLNPAGTYSQSGSYWSTTSETSGTLAAFVIGDAMAIGVNQGDFNGSNYTINIDNGGTWGGGGIYIGATNTQITFSGTANTHFGAATTVNVAQGSELIWDVTHDGGFNFNNEAITFIGGGTNYFEDVMGANDSALVTENMSGAVILGNTSVGSFPEPSGGYTLTAGTLDFLTQFAASTSFTNFGNGKFLSINGGSIDNISGSGIVINFGRYGSNGTNKFSIGGNFTFNGSSSLDLGTANMTNTGSFVIDVLNSTLAIGGAINGPTSSLGKAGPGELLLYGSSTYTGNTVVEGGTLALTNAGSLSSSSTIQVSNATFDVSGLAGNYAGASPIGLNGSTFNLSNILATAVSSLSATNSTLSVICQPATTTNIMTPVLNVGGATNYVNITFVPLVSSYPQTYHIINAGTINGTLNFGLSTLPPGQNYGGYITNRSNGVDFVLTNGPAAVTLLVWTGTNAFTGLPDGTWDINNSTNWLNSGVASAFAQLDLVTFNDSAAGQTTIDITGGETPGSLTVSNNVLGYTFTGSGLSDGVSPLTLTKQGTGILTLQENGDNFSGGISVGGGTVIVDNNSSGINGGATIASGATLQLGTNDTGAVLPSGTITVNGTLNINHQDNPNIASTMAGNGLVEQLNTNTVELSGTSIGNWSTLIENGTLQPANNASLGALPGGAVTITNGGTLDVGQNGTANDANFGAKQINIAGAGVGGNGAIVNSSGNTQEDAFQNVVLTTNATIGGTTRWDIRGGSPVLNLAGFTLTKTNANQISMVSPHVTSGNIVIQQGIISFESTPLFDASAGTITVNSGGAVGQYKDTQGSFTRSIVLNGGTNQDMAASGSTTYLDAPILLQANSSLYTLGGLEFYDGVISDGGAGFGVTLTGAGTNLLAGTNTYTGPTIIGQGMMGLTNLGSIAKSSVIYVINSAVFSVAGVTVPFSGTNAMVIGDDNLGQGTLNLGNTVITNFNYLGLSNAILWTAVDSYSATQITVTNLVLGDGGASSGINITSLPLLPVTVPFQFPLIKYGSMSGTYNLNLSTLPGGYTGNLINNTGNNSIDIRITGIPPGIWNGGDSPANDNWSDSVNWDGTGLAGSDALNFTGTAGLNNTNDEGSETATAITFIPGAGAFTLNGNPVTLTGGVTNDSSSLQTIGLGLDLNLSSGTNVTINAGTAGMTIPGGITNIESPWYTLHLQGTNGTLAGPVQSTAAPYNLAVTLDNIGGTNSWSMTGNNSSALTNLTITGNGSFTLGTGADSPTLAITNDLATAAIIVGNTTNTSSTLTMNSGTLALTNGANTPLDLGTLGASGTFNMLGGTLYVAGKYLQIGDSASTGTFNQTGGTVIANIANDIILGNSINNSTGTVNIAGGIFNATNNNSFLVALRGQGTWNVSGTGLVELQTLSMTRNSADSANASGTLNLNGGTVITTGESMGNAATGQTGAINFNGGVLQASTNSSPFISPAPTPSVLTTTVKVGGAVINDGGFAISISSPLIHDATLGSGTDGGLLKFGSGTLTLSNVDTYNGVTTVSNGTLLVMGSLGTNVVKVLTGATLSGNGTVGGNVSVTGTVAPGTPTSAGTLTSSGNVVYNVGSASTAKLDLNNNTNDLVSATGTITYGGTLNVTLLSGTPVSGQSNQLFKAGTYTGSFTATNLPVLGGGLVWVWTPANGTLSVVSTVTVPNVPPQISSFALAGSNVSITATNGVNNGTYYLLATTNVALPLNQWTAVATNVVTTSGGNAAFNFTGTNVVNGPMQFYILSSTNF